MNANTNVRDNSTDFIGELHILCSHGSSSALPTVEQGQASSRIISHAPTLQNTLNTGQHTHTGDKMRGNDKVRMKIIFRRRSVRTDDDSGERGDATLLERVFHLESINKSLGCCCCCETANTCAGNQ